VTPEGFGTPQSFTGGFVVDTRRAQPNRTVYGRFEVDPGLKRVMQSSTGFAQEQSLHIARSELCATCHTLFTHALGPDGEVIGTLPEQVPYLEWKHSDYVDAMSCQDCHMPVAGAAVPIASVLGEPREPFFQHVFRGGNFLLPRIFTLFGAELGVAALPQELERMARGTIEHLQAKSAELRVLSAAVEDGTLDVELELANLAGHKLPTAYPSRRAWLHVVVEDGQRAVIFESGALEPSGAIRGNANDADPRQYEPHYEVVESPDQVQVYEPILADAEGRVTTGLLRAVTYAKDNRLLPEGFDKAAAPADVAVHGAAAQDDDFDGGGDRIRYRVPLAGTRPPYRVTAKLLYQPIGFRWAHNLGAYEQPEPRRFLRYLEATADASAVVLAEASVADVREAAPPAEPAVR